MRTEKNDLREELSIVPQEQMGFISLHLTDPVTTSPDEEHGEGKLLYFTKTQRNCLLLSTTNDSTPGARDFNLFNAFGVVAKTMRK